MEILPRPARDLCFLPTAAVEVIVTGMVLEATRGGRGHGLRVRGPWMDGARCGTAATKGARGLLCQNRGIRLGRTGGSGCFASGGIASDVVGEAKDFIERFVEDGRWGWGGGQTVISGSFYMLHPLLFCRVKMCVLDVFL